ncbi:MAG: chromosome segregation protein SMC, partial [Candidatus Eremiobacteraeota bacterium]|nr:chromosome segregation protein SMC [Candidatus Eremiobacteraeota bacterium]
SLKLLNIKAFGFKTFAEPTSLEFEGGVTAIVGPNGSGKSNLVDAFRWALGEQSSKSLRSGKMEDVIFAGNDKRKPLGLAEVSLTFDNADGRLPTQYREVQITRRAYRAGEIEYYINRNHVRLRDVHDLLMGTGLGPGSYAIVSQGQVDAILTSKPQDRRTLFEETSGINKFLARKNESLRRLEQTEANAIRVSDLIAELERRAPELDTQVRRAKRYRKVSARLRDLEIVSYLRASASRREEREGVRHELDRHEERRSAAATKVATLSAQLAEERRLSYHGELALEEQRTQLAAQREEIAKLEADLAAATARRDALEGQSSVTSQDVHRAAADREQLQAKIAEVEAHHAPLEAMLERARANEAATQRALEDARSHLDRIFVDLRAQEASAADVAARSAERRVLIDNAREKNERLSAEIQNAQERSEQLEIAAGVQAQRLKQRRAELDALQTQQLDVRGRTEDAERAAQVASEELFSAQTAHREFQIEVASITSRLHTLEELEAALEGHVPGTRAVVEAWQGGLLRGIEGIVSDLISVDEQYARALDVAFGPRLSNVITKTSEDAERAIEHLTRQEAGRATFLPLDTLGSRTGRTLTPQLTKVAGVIGYAHTLVKTKPQYAGIIAFLVGAVLIVDDLQTGILLARKEGLRDTIVTLSGEQIFGGGAITGGRHKRERYILSRRVQAQTLRDRLPEMQAELQERELEVRRARERGERAGSARDAAQQKLNENERKLAELGADVAVLSAHGARLHEDFETARQRLVALQRELQSVYARERELSAAPTGEDPKAPREELESALRGAREELAVAEQAHAAAVGEVANLRERYAASTTERDAIIARLGLIDADRERSQAARKSLSAEISSLHTSVEELERTLNDLRAAIRTGEAAFESSRKEREASSARTLQLESDLRNAELAEREVQQGGESQRTRMAEIEAELGMLVSQFAQNPATDEECAEVAERYKDQEGDFAAEVPRLRDEMVRLESNVNLNAEAEREELSEREAFLRSQLDDLRQARETLLEVIREIETSTQAQFNETFEAVARAFSDVYRRLFPGGQARMWQTNPENLSETGIELSVQPPGKKMMSLSALSGGERAMVSAALIFALIQVRPAPFYLLDEVDAALDDMNIERFSTMVRELASDSQFILVTHNKKTMELADRLYGVTMGEPGVSTIISAELAHEREAAIA